MTSYSLILSATGSRSCGLESAVRVNPNFVSSQGLAFCKALAARRLARKADRWLGLHAVSELVAARA